MSDSYTTITNATEGIFRDRGSKFLAYVFPADTEEACSAFLLHCKKLHPKARHFCYAYRLKSDGSLFRANDDGEPSGTAGRPILGQIDSFGFTNVIVIVIRYFGGTKLGTSGLIAAYRNSAQDALCRAQKKKKYVEEVYRLNFDYAIMGDLMNTVKKLDLQIVDQAFDHQAYLEIAIRKSLVVSMLTRLKASIAKIQIEEAAGLESIDGLQIKHLYTR